MIRDAAPPGAGLDPHLSAPDAGGGRDVRAGRIGATAGAAEPPSSRWQRCHSRRAIACRFPGRRGQTLASFHHAGRLRRPERRRGHGGRRRCGTWPNCPMPSGASPWPSRFSTRRRWCTTTSKTTTPSATACPRVHRKHGVAAAINVGDYLIGLGYRLVAAAARGAGGRGGGRHPGPVCRRPYAALRRPGGRAVVARRAGPAT